MQSASGFRLTGFVLGCHRARLVRVAPLGTTPSEVPSGTYPMPENLVLLQRHRVDPELQSAGQRLRDRPRVVWDCAAVAVEVLNLHRG